MSGMNEWYGKKLGSWVTFSLSAKGYALTIMLSFPTASYKLYNSLPCPLVEVQMYKRADGSQRWLELPGRDWRLAGISWEMGGARRGQRSGTHPGLIFPRHPNHRHNWQARDNSEAPPNNSFRVMPASLTSLWIWIILLLHWSNVNIAMNHRFLCELGLNCVGTGSQSFLLRLKVKVAPLCISPSLSPGPSPTRAGRGFLLLSSPKSRLRYFSGKNLAP